MVTTTSPSSSASSPSAHCTAWPVPSCSSCTAVDDVRSDLGEVGLDLLTLMTDDDDDVLGLHLRWPPSRRSSASSGRPSSCSSFERRGPHPGALARGQDHDGRDRSV